MERLAEGGRVGEDRTEDGTEEHCPAVLRAKPGSVELLADAAEAVAVAIMCLPIKGTNFCVFITDNGMCQEGPPLRRHGCIFKLGKEEHSSGGVPEEAAARGTP